MEVTSWDLRDCRLVIRDDRQHGHTALQSTKLGRGITALLNKSFKSDQEMWGCKYLPGTCRSTRR